jgi:hypothetical protein
MIAWMEGSFCLSLAIQIYNPKPNKEDNLSRSKYQVRGYRILPR